MTPSPEHRAHLLSDVDGRITHVFQALPAEEPEAVPRLLECHGGVRRALGPDVRYTLLIHPEHETIVRAHTADLDTRLILWAKPRTLRIASRTSRMEGRTLRLGLVPGWGDFTPWVQDTFLVRSDGDASTLMASPEIRRPHGSLDEDVPPLLAGALGWPCVTLPTGLEAANVLADRHLVFVGSDVVRSRPRAVVQRLLADLRGDRRIVTFPLGAPQPLAHQDLYLTPAGDTEHGPLAFVGSCRLAAEIRGTAFEPTATQSVLDAIAADLEHLGYTVDRLPLEPHSTDPANRAWNSYNNVLVEIIDKPTRVRRVVLPAYGTDGGSPLRALDDAAAAIWSRRGFAIRWAEGPFDWLSVHEGGLRCLTKVLERREC